MTANSTQTISPDVLRTMPLPAWSDDDSKDDYGKLLIIAGSARLPGAAILVARAALRVGCGTVRVAAPASVASLVGVALPELMVIPLAETTHGTAALTALPQLQQQYGPCDAVVLGPGLDNDEDTNQLALQVMAECPLPMVIDAQALTAAADGRVDYGTTKGYRVFTPHAGDMAALLKQSAEVIERHREDIARTFATKRTATLVLKGRETLIADPDGSLYGNTAGTRGLGTAGSGDVLAGVIGSLLAQGMKPTRAAVWGVHLQALAGEATAKDLGDDGMMASDFIERLPNVLRSLGARTDSGRCGALSEPRASATG